MILWVATKTQSSRAAEGGKGKGKGGGDPGHPPATARRSVAFLYETHWFCGSGYREMRLDPEARGHQRPSSIG